MTLAGAYYSRPKGDILEQTAFTKPEISRIDWSNNEQQSVSRVKWADDLQFVRLYPVCVTLYGASPLRFFQNLDFYGFTDVIIDGGSIIRTRRNSC